MSIKLDRLRLDADRLRAALISGEDGVTVQDVARAQDAVIAEAGRELVDDPFQPGQRVRASQADTHPGRRLHVAVEAQMQANGERDRQSADKTIATAVARTMGAGS